MPHDTDNEPIFRRSDAERISVVCTFDCYECEPRFKNQRERFLRDASRKLCRARGIREIRDFRSVPLRTGPSSGEMTLRRKLLWKTATFNYEYKGSLDVARYSLLPVHLFVLHEPVWDGSPLFLQIGAFARINENGSAVHWNPIGKPTWTA